MPPAVQELGKNHTAAAVALLSEAFLDYPAFLAVGPRRPSARRWLIRSYYRSRIAVARRFGGSCWVALAGAQLVGVAIIFHPGRHQQPAWALAYQTRFLLFGPGTVARGLRAQAAMAEAQLDEPHVWLDSLGVDPARQGSGAGRALVRAVTQRSEQFGVPAFLHTARPENRSYYAQFGFENVSEGQLPRGYRFWSMLRGA